MSLCSRSGYFTNTLHEGDKPIDSELVREYKNIFIKVNSWGSFEYRDIRQNGLCQYDNWARVPDFVAEFERKLDIMPGLASDVCCFFDHPFDVDSQCRHIELSNLLMTLNFSTHILGLSRDYHQGPITKGIYL